MDVDAWAEKAAEDLISDAEDHSEWDINEFYQALVLVAASIEERINVASSDGVELSRGR